MRGIFQQGQCFGLAIAATAAVVAISNGRLVAQETEEAAPAATVTIEAEVVEEAPAEAAAATTADFPASHKQTAIIKIVDDRGDEQTLNTFCLAADGRLLTGVGSKPGEIRVFSAEGKFQQSWPLPIKVEAINIGPDSVIYVAGSGKLLKLDADGNILLERPAPQARQLKVDSEKLREQVIASAKQQAEAYVRYPEMFRQQITRLEEAIKAIKDKDDEATDAEQTQVKALEQQIELYRTSLKRYEELAKNNPADGLTEEQIQERIDQMIEYKTGVSSLSATTNDVFIACRALEGYGFDVWRTDLSFKKPKSIVTGLRGCCGQMDVQADDNGVFVAENARHRVCRYDRDGNMECEWGSGARDSVEGFGSCCNPMNVAFGPKDEVYTAEATSGRIKRYTPDGKLQGVVGSVEIVPGCKKVSIAVNQDGSRVYMMDLTRTHIVVMSAVKAGKSATN